jgi:hypothetical protein
MASIGGSKTLSDTSDKKTKTFNWWTTKALSGLALIYLVGSLASSLKPGNERLQPFKTDHLILFSIILIFNSEILEKIEAISLGNLSAKFATKESVDKLGAEINALILDIILDDFERKTLKAINEKTENYEFEINPAGRGLLERLINRNMIQEVFRQEETILKAQDGEKIAPGFHFDIQEKGTG